MRSAASFFLRLLFPPRCVACGGAADEEEPFCATCSLSVLTAAANPPADARGFPFLAAVAPLVYGGAVADAIVRFKHGGRLASAVPLGRLLAPVLGWAAEEGASLAAPVPLHPARLRRRGFNQALELLRAGEQQRLRETTGAPLPIVPDVLVRHRDTAPMGHEPPAVRRQRVAGAFRIRRASEVQGRRVLLVDDVMTTGATLSECTRVLLEAGAEGVLVAALARVE
jgi:ComF family protein